MGSELPPTAHDGSISPEFGHELDLPPPRIVRAIQIVLRRVVDSSVSTPLLSHKSRKAGRPATPREEQAESSSVQGDGASLFFTDEGVEFIEDDLSTETGGVSYTITVGAYPIKKPS